jgi:hypothetical protein
VRGLRPGIRATVKSFARASKKAQDVKIKPSRDRRAQQPAPTAENRTRVSNSDSNSGSNRGSNSVSNSDSNSGSNRVSDSVTSVAGVRLVIT